MDLRRIAPLGLALSASLLASACNPYKNLSGEFWGGSVDPAKFPAAYQGAGFAHSQAFGSFTASSAFYKGEAAQLGYYPFPFATLQGSQGLLVADPNVMPPDGQFFLTTPDVFNFDNQYPTNPFPSQPKCAVPPGYQFDQRTEAFRQDQQGAIFTALPDGTGLDPASVSGYLPIVAETAVTSNGEPCNGIKSAEGIVQRTDVTLQTIPIPVGSDPSNTFPTGKQDERYLAWAIIDPSADVSFPDGSHDPNTGLGPQQWGWFNHLLLAYMDGGYIPTDPPNPNPGDMATLVFQNLYVPDDGTGGTSLMGMGMDVLSKARGVDADYSPLCMVNVFTPLDGVTVTDEQQIIGPNMANFVAGPPTPTGTVIACIQVQ